MASDHTLSGTRSETPSERLDAETRLEAELSNAQADLELRLNELKHAVTDRVAATVERVERPLRWLSRNRWRLLGGVIAFVVLVTGARIARRRLLA